jgi:biopolymer transport protein ExbD
VRFEPSSRKRRRPTLTPLIDVVFLLLVFFMLATSFGSEASLALHVGAPTAASRLPGDTGDTGNGSDAAADAKRETIRINLSADGRIRVNGESVREDEVSGAILRALAGHHERPVRVLADDASPLQAIATVLAALERAGAEDVGLALATPTEAHE